MLISPFLDRPLLEFLACFTEREVDLAEEVLQLLLYWLQQPPDGAPPPGLLDTIRDFFPSRSGLYILTYEDHSPSQ